MSDHNSVNTNESPSIIKEGDNVKVANVFLESKVRRLECRVENAELTSKRSKTTMSKYTTTYHTTTSIFFVPSLEILVRILFSGRVGPYVPTEG